MKGCLLFVALFLLGSGLMVTGLAQDLMVEGLAVPRSASAKAGNPRNTPRILEVSGLVVMFGAIYGAAGWRFSRWNRKKDDEPSPR